MSTRFFGVGFVGSAVVVLRGYAEEKRELLGPPELDRSIASGISHEDLSVLREYWD
jgi:hypothetical protein